MPLPLNAAAPPAVVSMRAKALAERVAASEVAVLIIGQTGTEKELVARHVHAYSGRTGPFIAADCGALGGARADAELFDPDTGCFAAAHRGTLFLDDVGALPLQTQGRLLRVLDHGELPRPGTREAVAVDVRLVAAHPSDLAAAVTAGRFRRDLYYRLNIAPLQLLPLAQRQADILPLARHFIALHGQRLGRASVRLSDAASRALLEHPWPGNLRELESVIHCALIQCSGPEIAPEALQLNAAF